MPSNRPKKLRPRVPPRNAAVRSEQTPPTQGAERAPQPAAQFSYQEQTTGGLIPPLMLERYQRIQPDFPERWLTMAERQEAHRQRLETLALVGDGRRAWTGIACAFLLCLAALAAAVIIALAAAVIIALARHDPGATYLSGVLGTSGLVGLAGVFIYGTRSRRQERADKARLMTGQR